MSRPFILLDRDGVINTYTPNVFVSEIERFFFVPGTLEALKKLRAADYGVVVISNQSGIGRGHLTRAELDAVTAKMIADVAAAGARIDDIFYCVHGPDENCRCRKPRPGMLVDAAAKHGFDLARTWFVGDSITDVQAAHAAGCRSALVRTGQARDANVESWREKPEMIEPDLLHFVDRIL